MGKDGALTERSQASARRSTTPTGVLSPRSVATDRTPRKGGHNNSFRLGSLSDAAATPIPDESELDYWGKLWRAAGYVPARNGDYVKAPGGVLGAKPTEESIRAMVDTELAEQERWLAADTPTSHRAVRQDAGDARERRGRRRDSRRRRASPAVAAHANVGGGVVRGMADDGDRAVAIGVSDH